MYNQEQIPGQEQAKKSNKSLWVIILVVALAAGCLSVMVIGVLAAILVPNFIKAKSQGQLVACKSNMKNIATSLEMYATDNYGKYPATLNKLLEPSSSGSSYLMHIPICPACQESYIYNSSKEPDDFLLQCGGMNTHTGAGAGEGHFPQYTPGKGLILR
jgi:type II secretory pathway pseudopilin PulG